MARRELWDGSELVQKPWPCDDGTANSVNGALAMQSHVDLFTLDRFVHTASTFIQRSWSRGYSGGFDCVVLDHDQAYRRGWRTRRFRCLVPIAAPAGGGYVGVGGVQTFIAAGDLVFLEMHRLLFGEAGAVAAYCGISRLVVAVVAKVLALPVGAYIYNFSSLFWLLDVRLPAQLWDFVRNVLRVALHEDKFYEGVRPLFLGMPLAFSPSGISLRLSPERMSKYAPLVDWYIEDGGMTKSQATEPAGRLNWACNALFGRCGQAFLAPILSRASNKDPRWEINGRMRRSLGWWSAPLPREVPCQVRPLRPAVPAPPRSVLLRPQHRLRPRRRPLPP